MLGFVLLSLWLIVAPAVFAHPAVQPAVENWLEPFVEGIGVSAEVTNPSQTGMGGYSTFWRVDVIALAPGEHFTGRPHFELSAGPEAPREAAFARGDHLLFAVLGGVSVDTSAGERFDLIGGNGLIMTGDFKASNPIGMEYTISNLTAACATVLRLSVTGLGGMAGARAPQETPALPGSCGESRTLFRGTHYSAESTGLTAYMALLHSSGTELWESRPDLTVGQPVGIAVLQGDIVLELMGGCDSCPNTQLTLYAPGAITLEPTQRFYLGLADATLRDEVVLLVASLSPVESTVPILYASEAL